MKYLWPLMLFLVLISCKYDSTKNQALKDDLNQKTIETITLLGDTLYTPKALPSKILDNYTKAKNHYLSHPDSAEAIIWYGRRTAYLKHFQRAIAIYSEGMQKFPKDARFYRHRAHRYISTRQYDKAIKDLKKAVTLIGGGPQ